MVDHTTHAFDVDLQELGRKIMKMGRLDDEQIATMIDALVNSDLELARRVIVADDQVDTLQHEIEEKAIATIARRQPMAVDLRQIVGALRISNDLAACGKTRKLSHHSLSCGATVLAPCSIIWW